MTCNVYHRITKLLQASLSKMNLKLVLNSIYAKYKDGGRKKLFCKRKDSAKYLGNRSKPLGLIVKM